MSYETSSFEHAADHPADSNDDFPGKSWEDEFNQGGDQDGEDEESAESKKGHEDFAAMLDASLTKKSKRLNVGDKIRGEILVLGKEDVFVSTGTQNDGMASRRDLVEATKSTDATLPYKVGDMIELYVTSVSTSKGGTEIRLSPNPTSKNMASDLYDAYRGRQPIDGKVVETCNGGFRVQVKSKLAFCPISQMDSKHIEGAGEEYVGQKFAFLITKIDEGGRNIVVSRRKLLDQDSAASAGHFAAEKKVGDIVQGKVARLEKFGAFIELAPGIDGLAHISELSWSRVNDPAEAVHVGETVSAKILKMENVETPKGSRMRVSLSIKQAGAQPWENIPGSVKAGQLVEGKVTRLAQFGAFVEIAPGLEGLVPLSEMSHTKRIMRADEVVKEGERISVMVKDVNPETRRISLSIKDAGTDPWSLAQHNFPVGTVFKGRVERREAYGLFIKLDEGVVGLLPKSVALAATDFPFDKLKVGEEVTVQVAEFKREERRVSLQPPKDPGADDWKGFVSTGESGTGFATFASMADKLKAAMTGQAGKTKPKK